MAKTALILDNEELKKIIGESVASAMIEILPSLAKGRKPESDYINIDQASKFLQLAKQTCYQNINSIPHFKINGKLLFKKSELVEYIESNGNSKNN